MTQADWINFQEFIVLNNSALLYWAGAILLASAVIIAVRLIVFPR